MTCDPHPRQMCLARAGFHWQPGEGVWEYAGVLQLSDEQIDTMEPAQWQRFLATFIEGGPMNHEDIRQAIRQLKAQGQPVTGPRVHELLGKRGSLRDVYAEIKADHGALIEEESTANGPIPENPPEPVANALRELQTAEAALAKAEQAIPSLQAAVAEAREAALQASAAYDRLQGAVRLHVLSPRDASLGQAAAALQTATERLKSAERALVQAAGAIATRKALIRMHTGALQQAKRETFLQQERPELWERLQQIEQGRRGDQRISGSDWGDHIRATAEHAQQKQALMARCEAVYREAGI